MLIEKICPKCGKKYTTIDKFPDEVCEPCFDKYFEKIENNNSDVNLSGAELSKKMYMELYTPEQIEAIQKLIEKRVNEL